MLEINRAEQAERHIRIRPQAGALALILQCNRLRYSNLTIDAPVLILVENGRKILRGAAGEHILCAGEAIALQSGQVFDVTNEATAENDYRARAIIIDPGIVSDFRERCAASRPIDRALPLQRLEADFRRTFDGAAHAIAHPDDVPLAVARHRIGELLVWLDLRGGHFSPDDDQTVTQRVRRLVMAEPDGAWTGAAIGRRLAMSEATLRRRLAAEDTSLQAMIIDVRMSAALQLLQSTSLPVLHIAQAVGYESQSRFAGRFRSRFGFAPSAIRGHRR